MNKKLVFVLVIIMQLLFLGGMALFHISNLNRATKILLETEPVDPFSPFRGRYINLNYKISTIPATLLKDCSSRDLKSDDCVYVVLKKKEKFWEPIAAYKNRPEDTNFTFLKGKVYHSYSHSIRIKYGIESFFLSEESADEIERESRTFGGGNWQEIQRQRKERMERLSDEDKRIRRIGITEQWFKKLDKEIGHWLKKGIIVQETATKIREKYTKALGRIRAARQIGAERTAGQRTPLTVEVAVTKKGRGYPTKLFWKDKQYH